MHTVYSYNTNMLFNFFEGFRSIHTSTLCVPNIHVIYNIKPPLYLNIYTCMPSMTLEVHIIWHAGLLLPTVYLYVGNDIVIKIKIFSTKYL